jgi:hypothetical protein
MRHHGRARVSVDHPEAFAVCDGCGLTYNHVDLGFDYQWRGQRLQTKRMLKCETCRDLPNDQLFALKLPPDPVGLKVARPENYAVDEVTIRITQDGEFRVTQDDDIRVTQDSRD